MAALDPRLRVKLTTRKTCEIFVAVSRWKVHGMHWDPDRAPVYTDPSIQGFFNGARCNLDKCKTNCSLYTLLTATDQKPSFKLSYAKIRRRVWPVGEFTKRVMNEYKIGYISTIRPEAPRGRMCTKFDRAVGVAGTISCDNFWWSVEGCRIDSVWGRKLAPSAKVP